MIDWSDPGSKISRYFTVHEAIWLPRWRRHANESDGLDHVVQSALIEIFMRLDLVQEFLERPITVHSAYRPFVYNKEIGGSATSCHMARLWQGQLIAAVDFSAGESCDLTRAKLEPELAPLGLRMEKLPGSKWVHLDNRLPGPAGRYFAP